MQYLASKISKKALLDHLNGVQVVGGSNPPIPMAKRALNWLIK
jgi:hypothetical protein